MNFAEIHLRSFIFYLLSFICLCSPSHLRGAFVISGCSDCCSDSAGSYFDSDSCSDFADCSADFGSDSYSAS